MALDVDAAASGPAGELCVLARRDRDVRFAVVLLKLFHDDGACRHVDAQGKGFRGEDRLDQSPGKEVLNYFLEDRKQSRVVGGEPAHESLAPRPEAEDFKVVGGQLVGNHVDRLLDLRGFGGRGQGQSGAHALGDSRVAAVAGEDEDQRGQQPGPVQGHDHVGPGDFRAELLPLPAAVSVAAAASAALGGT